MARRRQVQRGGDPRQSITRDLRRRRNFAVGGLIALIGLHVVAIMAFEGLTAGEGIWLTFTTITTTGYGDYSAKSTAGRASTIILIYLSGIFLLSQAAGAFFELRTIRRERMRSGEWRWTVENHIVFVNTPAENPGDYLRRLLDQLHRSHAGFARVPAVVISNSFPRGLPPTLEDDPLVMQVRGRFDDPATLDAANIDKAKIVVVLAEREGDRLSDAHTFDTVHRLRERNTTARVIAECVDDCNRDRLKRAGATVVVRPMRGYPEMVVRAIVAPGSEQIIEGLFSSEGDECLRYDVTVQGLPWSSVVACLVHAGQGTTIGYADESGRVHTNPPPDAKVTTSALYVLVAEEQNPTAESMQRVIDKARDA